MKKLILLFTAITIIILSCACANTTEVSEPVAESTAAIATATPEPTPEPTPELTPEPTIEPIDEYVNEVHIIASTHYAFEKSEAFLMLSDDYEDMLEAAIQYYPKSAVETDEDSSDNFIVYIVSDMIRDGGHTGFYYPTFYDEDKKKLKDQKLGASTVEIINAVAYLTSEVDIPIIKDLVSECNHPYKFEIFVEVVKKMNMRVAEETNDSITIQVHTIDNLADDIWKVTNNRWILELINDVEHTDFITITREDFQ